ncbi:hypothetical protein CVT26_007686 [Gymnopilus dilepis]|uniref:Uncharacterized protein n=1 Tax=Gymnopilus dilepis TaxID=231916 RepID=A0A409WSD2_9AGAR|nr:hypothetical protein CVT26_007686 [Gymnopilus dilepis]
MSTSSHPSGWDEPRQFTIPMPFDYIPNNPTFLLVCSATHVVVGRRNVNRAYIYSLPTFDVNVLELEDISHPTSFEIYGAILVSRCWHSSDGSGDAHRLYVYDLSTGECLNVVPDDIDHDKTTISFPRTEHDRVVRGEWPKTPTLVICSGGQTLQTYTIGRSFKQTGHNIEEEESATMASALTISLSHRVLCHASIGRTAVTGGRDATVRVWDIVTGQCRLVLIGHRLEVNNVCLDKARIYSASADDAVRVWDRYSGDCVHILEWPPFQSYSISELDTTPSYLMCTVFIIADAHYPYTTLVSMIWDPVSGRLVHQISSNRKCCQGPMRGKELTLVSYERDKDSGVEYLKIWDVESGQELMRSRAGPRSIFLRFCSQERFIIALALQDLEYKLKVWDFGDNIPLSSEDDVSSNHEGTREDNLGKKKAEGSIIDNRKRSNAKDFIRRLFRKR